MSKNIKLQLINPDELEFEITEDAKAGDRIALKDLNNLDLSFVDKQIQEKRERSVQELLAKEKTIWENDFKVHGEYATLMNSFNNLKAEKSQLKQQLDLQAEMFQKEKHAIIDQFKQSDDYKKLEDRERTLQIRLNEKEAEFKRALSENEQNIINKYKQSAEFKQMENALIKANNDILNINQLKEHEIQNAVLAKEKEWNDRYSELKNENENLKRQKSTMHSQGIGSEFEHWIQNEFNKTLGNVEDCLLERTTKTIENTKPDFLFKLLGKDNQPYASVTIEAKSENPNSASKQKNKSFYKTLDKNRENNNSDIALLVTEVEPEEDFFIMRVPDPTYTNMYQCRPQGLITFLSILRLIYKKREDLLAANGSIEFKEKQKIIDDFNELKDDIIDKTLKNVKGTVGKIINKSESIKKYAEEINDDAKTLLDKHLATLEKKLNNLHLNTLKKVDKNSDFFGN